MMIHRLVALTFIPNTENKPEVNHIDNNPLNNHVKNLEWCTRSENVRHSFATTVRKTNLGIKIDTTNKKRGEKSSSSKLSDYNVEEIRTKYIPNIYSLSKLAKEYNVSKKLILLIIQNKHRAK